MTDANQLSLFGLDLRRVVAYARLAANQLAFGPELGLYARFAEPLWVWSLEHDTPRYQTSEAEHTPTEPLDTPASPSISTPTPPDQLNVGDWAVWIPDDNCLLRELSLPTGAEIDIEDFVRFEVSANSPFGWDDTRYGWRIIERTPDTLHLVVAITSLGGIDQTLSDLLGRHALLRDALPKDAIGTTSIEGGDEHYQLQPSAWPQCWVASPDGTPIILQGDAQQAEGEPPSVALPKARYIAQLQRTAGLWAAGLALCFAILWVPAYTLNVMAAKADDTLATLNRSAAQSVALREQLGAERNRLAVAQQAINERVDYHFWLNVLAGITPDTVHLQRASLKGRDIAITGLADNAADYMTLLTEDARLTNVEVPTAFRRDRNSGMERFSVSFTVVPEALGEAHFAPVTDNALAPATEPDPEPATESDSGRVVDPGQDPDQNPAQAAKDAPEQAAKQAFNTSAAAPNTTGPGNTSFAFTTVPRAQDALAGAGERARGEPPSIKGESP